jgi:glycosyltransferase involved in cell wall biosynthesis
MRIGLYGNTCNNLFSVTRALRAGSDIDAHLFIDDDADWIQLPEHEDPQLCHEYPDWIHKGPYRPLASRVWPRATPLLSELREFDMVMVSGHGVRLAPFVDRPFIFYVTGWDLTVSPFPIRFFSRPEGLGRRVSAMIGGTWQRKGIRAAAEIWSQPFAPFVTALTRLDVPREKIVSKYFPLMIDTDLFSCDPQAAASADPNVRRVVDDHDFVVFHPSRMMINRAPRFIDTGQWKGNDKLFEGFARFVSANPQARPVLALIDRTASPDILQARSLITRLGLDSRVVWLKPPRGPGFERHDLVRFYSVADVVADEFGVGWFGSVVVEGLSVGKPVLCYLDAEVMQQLYPWHPVLSPRTEDEIAECLTDLYRDPARRARLGDVGRRWAVEFHSFQNAGTRYVGQIRELVRAL